MPSNITLIRLSLHPRPLPPDRTSLPFGRVVFPLTHNNRTWFAVLIAILLVAAVFGSFGFSLLSAQTPKITLPNLQPDSSAGDISIAPDNQAVRVEVTTQTVQAVIASLDRAASYYRQMSVQTNWQGGSGTTTIYTWVDDEYTFVRSILPTGTIRFFLSDRDTVYYWYGGSSSWRTAPSNSLSADLTQRVPTYEDVLMLAPEDISGAGYSTYGELPCIYVETKSNELGYLERYWIGVDSGLLIAAQTMKGDEVIYSLNATSPIQTPCPTDSVFTLPNGTVLHSF